MSATKRDRKTSKSTARDTPLGKAPLQLGISETGEWPSNWSLRFLVNHAVATCRRCWKHSRQKTGRPCVGLNGTVVSLPHCEQTVRVSTFAIPCTGVAEPNTETLFVLHALHRLGSFLNCLSWKKSCSPAVKIKSDPQSIHFNTLSWNSIESAPFNPFFTQHAARKRWCTTRSLPPQFSGNSTTRTRPATSAPDVDTA